MSKKLNRHFSKDIQLTNKYIKKHWTSLITREMQRKATMRYHLTPVKMATVKKEVLTRTWRKWSPVHCWQECTLVQSLWKTVWLFLNIQKPDLLYDSPIWLLGIYPKIIQYPSTFPCAIVEKWKQLTCLQMKKMRYWYICIYIHITEYFLLTKMCEILPFAKPWMEIIMLK
jgi:hypothetical protein